jgi:hypothetical protein
MIKEIQIDFKSYVGENPVFVEATVKEDYVDIDEVTLMGEDEKMLGSLDIGNLGDWTMRDGVGEFVSVHDNLVHEALDVAIHD